MVFAGYFLNVRGFVSSELFEWPLLVAKAATAKLRDSSGRCSRTLATVSFSRLCHPDLQTNAMSICPSCLWRLRALSIRSHSGISAQIPSARAFHSSPLQSASVQKKKNPPVAKKLRESQSARIKRKRVERPKPPAVGERKALRKRIVLSNTNALEIDNMEDLSPGNMIAEDRVGQFLGLNGPLLDQLREAKAFKTTQNWNMFRRPATLMRKETVDIGRLVAEVSDGVANQGPGTATVRRIITGEASTGKSLLLLQAMGLAYMNKWVVLNIPEAQDITIGQSSYAPMQSIDSKKEQLYVQPEMTVQLLSRAAYSNDKVLSSLKVAHKHTIPEVRTSFDMSLKDLALAGAETPSYAWAVWQAFWKELTVPVEKAARPPVLIAIDGLDHWMTTSKYRSAAYELVHAHQLALVRQFVNVLFSQPSGESLPNGGMIIAATSGSNSPTLPDFSLLLRQLKARQSGMQVTDEGFPMPEPYRNIDQHVTNLIGAAEKPELVTLQGLSRGEAKGLLEYYARSGMMRESITEAIVGEKWSLSGGGVIGEMAKLGKRVRVL